MSNRTLQACRVQFVHRGHHYTYDFTPETRMALRFEIARQVICREVTFGWMTAAKVYRAIDRAIKRMGK